MIHYQNFFKEYLPYAALLFVFLYQFLKFAYQKSIIIVFGVNIFALLHVWGLLFFMDFKLIGFFVLVVCHVMLFVLNKRARSDAGRKP